MFPFNIDPTFIDATVQSEVTQNLKTMKNGPMMIGGFITLLVAAGVAVFIMQKAFKGSISPDECQMMVSAAKCGSVQMAQTVATAAVQAVNITPLG